MRFADRRQHLPGRGLAPGRRDEQLPGRPGQAQRTGQQFGGVLAGGAVDAPLQVADRPRAQARRFGQLLLGQPRPGPQLPQQPAETQRSLFRHQHSVPPQESPGHEIRPKVTRGPHGHRDYRKYSHSDYPEVLCARGHATCVVPASGPVPGHVTSYVGPHAWRSSRLRGTVNQPAAGASRPVPRQAGEPDHDR